MPGSISVFGRLVEWALGGIVDMFSKSPLDQDFGEAADTDIQVPNSEFSTRCKIEEMYPALLKMFETIDGLAADHLKKIAVRVNELPIDRSAEFRFQVRDGRGEPAELQLRLTKCTSFDIDANFHSSRELIEMISAAFSDKGASA